MGGLDHTNLTVERLLDQAWQLTMLALVVALAGRLLERRHPTLVHLLWLVVLVKAVTPPWIAAPTGVFSWIIGPSTTIVLPATTHGPAVAIAPATAAPSDIVQALIGVWAVGAVLALAWWGLRAWSLARMIRAYRLPEGNRLLTRARELAAGVPAELDLVVSPAGIGPAVCGFRRTTIILPQSLVDACDWEMLRPVLAHELAHAARRDPLVTALGSLVLCLWWFHPLMWWAVDSTKRVSERCVDRAVLGEWRVRLVDYARSLLKVVELRSQLRLSYGLTGLRPCGITAERLELLRTDPRQARTQRSVHQWLVAITLGCIFLPGAPLAALQTKCTGPAERSTTSGSDTVSADLAHTPSVSLLEGS
jgi:beta-lactamase regulating signal transducer with metallopeptidase domain